MPDQVVAVDQVLDAMIADDARRIVLRLQDVGANEIALDLPLAQIPRLIACSSRLLSDSTRRQAPGSGLRARVDLTWWNLEPDDRDGFLLSLNFGGGGSLSFDLSPHVAATLLAVLKAHFDEAMVSSIERRGFVQ